MAVILTALALLVCRVGAHQGRQGAESALSALEELTADPLAWKNTELSADARATLLVAAMTIEEQARMLARWSKNIPKVTDWTGGTVGIERLGVPEIHYQDGPAGFVSDDGNLYPGTTTGYPSGLAFAHSWSKDLHYLWGKHLGQEFREKGAGVVLGPAMNMLRVPRNGRGFEYIGEDPVVGAELVTPVVEGIQSNSVLATMKHYVNNEQESLRLWQSANVDERTQMEMYYPPFEGAVKGGAGAAMCAYNKVNHHYACANNRTLNYHLREVLGFDGFVMSDWGAIQGRPKEYVLAGCDQEQGGADSYTVGNLTEELDAAQLYTPVHRVVKSFIKAGLYDSPPQPDFARNVTTSERKAVARLGAEKSTVLLKNEKKTLPLNRNDILELLVLGNASAYPIRIGGTGSVGSGHTSYSSPPLWTLCDELNISRAELPLDSTAPKRACDATNARCITYVGEINTNGNGPLGAFADGDSLTPENTPADVEKWLYQQHASSPPKIDTTPQPFEHVEYNATMIFAGVNAGENWDRANLSWYGEGVLERLKQVKHPGKVVSLLTAPGPVILNDLRDASDALLFNVMPGEKYGEAIIPIVFGKKSPQGRLPYTMPNIENEQKMSTAQFPGQDRMLNASYSEKHHFGYRWYDQNNVKPAYEFGYGLTYSEFEYSNIKVLSNLSSNSEVLVQINLKNTGKMAATEIPQLYLAVPETENYSAGYRSPKTLKAFDEVYLEPNAGKSVQFKLAPRAFSYWSTKDQKWHVEPGTYKVLVGASSRDIKLSADLVI